MAWEDILKKQSDRLTRLIDDSVIAWRDAKAKAETPAGFTANEAATDMTKFWNNLLKFWWGPFDLGSPNIPTLLITSAPSNPSPVHGDCRLLDDTVTANVAITDLGRIGGTETIASATNITRTVTEGTKLTVDVSGVPATKGLYQGLALEGNEPVAVVILKVG